jgi:hypothetical protein
MTRQLVAACRYFTFVTLVLIAAAAMSQSDAQPSASPVDLGTYEVVKLVYGVNAVGFGPAGTQGTVLLGWRENFNAHGFGVGTFYLKAPKGTIPTGFQNDDVLGLVTVWDDTHRYHEAQRRPDPLPAQRRPAQQMVLPYEGPRGGPLQDRRS